MNNICSSKTKLLPPKVSHAGPGSTSSILLPIPAPSSVQVTSPCWCRGGSHLPPVCPSQLSRGQVGYLSGSSLCILFIRLKLPLLGRGQTCGCGEADLLFCKRKLWGWLLRQWALQRSGFFKEGFAKGIRVNLKTKGRHLCKGGAVGLWRGDP